MSHKGLISSSMTCSLAIKAFLEGFRLIEKEASPFRKEDLQCALRRPKRAALLVIAASAEPFLHSCLLLEHLVFFRHRSFSIPAFAGESAGFFYAAS